MHTDDHACVVLGGTATGLGKRADRGLAGTDSAERAAQKDLIAVEDRAMASAVSSILMDDKSNHVPEHGAGRYTLLDWPNSMTRDRSRLDQHAPLDGPIEASGMPVEAWSRARSVVHSS